MTSTSSSISATSPATSSPAPESASSSRLKFFILWLVVPYGIGYLASHGYLSILDGFIQSFMKASDAHTERTLVETMLPINTDECDRRFLSMFGPNLEDFENFSVMVHHNGDPSYCGKIDSGSSFVNELKMTYMALSCPEKLSKYQVESLLTKTLNSMVSTSCYSKEKHGKKSDGFLGFCDMGKKHTPILLDHNDLVPVQMPGNKTSLPCRFHTREGLRISELKQFSEIMTARASKIQQQSQNQDTDCEQHDGSTPCKTSGAPPNEIHLYAVPAGRVFMFAPSHVGEVFDLPHVPGADQRSIYLEVLSLEPRVFDVFNFFSREESQDLVNRAIAEKSESHRIKRSTTGAGSHSVNSRRTSESGFDTHGTTATIVKKRCFKALGFDEYWESHGDGLQILRYNISKAYNSHLDWIEDKTGELEHDFESGGTGGNRFATILLYMSDLDEEDGGETVFPRAWPPQLPKEERLDQKEVLNQLRKSERGSVLERGSWEEDLVAKCRSRLSVRPHSSRAVLFYSQYPNGAVDPASLHGACPVLNKQKYAANLWVWNTPRQGFPGAPIKEKFRKGRGDSNTSPSANQFKKITATFQNSGQDGALQEADLYYEDQFWGILRNGSPVLSVNTYQGHVWNVKVNNEIVKTWIISEQDGDVQKFVI